MVENRPWIVVTATAYLANKLHFAQLWSNMAEPENEIFSDEHFQARLQSKQGVETPVRHESDQGANPQKFLRPCNFNMSGGNGYLASALDDSVR